MQVHHAGRGVDLYKLLDHGSSARDVGREDGTPYGPPQNSGRSVSLASGAYIAYHIDVRSDLWFFKTQN